MKMKIGFQKLSEQEQQARREKLRAKGVVHYIVFQGVLIYGLLAFAIDCLANAFLWHKHLDPVFFLSKITQWVFAGLLFGWIVWRWEFKNERTSK